MNSTTPPPGPRPNDNEPVSHLQLRLFQAVWLEDRNRMTAVIRDHDDWIERLQLGIVALHTFQSLGVKPNGEPVAPLPADVLRTIATAANRQAGAAERQAKAAERQADAGEATAAAVSSGLSDTVEAITNGTEALALAVLSPRLSEQTKAILRKELDLGPEDLK